MAHDIAMLKIGIWIAERLNMAALANRLRVLNLSVRAGWGFEQSLERAV
jgi:hypothetical protein